MGIVDPKKVEPFFKTEAVAAAEIRPLGPLTNVPVVQKMRRGEVAFAKKRDETMRAAYEEGYRRGQELGFEEGLDRGRHEAYRNAAEDAYKERHEELEAFAASLKRVLDSTNEAMSRWYAQAEEEMGPVVIDIARKVLVSELRLGRDSIREMIADAMKEVAHAATAKIRINPLDSPEARAYLDEIKGALIRLKQIEIVDDKSIEGGCVIETDSGMVDARIEHKIEAIERSIQEAA